MIIEVSYGTPETLASKTYSQQGVAKKFLRDKVSNTQAWARKFAHDVSIRCESIRAEIDSTDISTIPEGETRAWRVTDPVSNVTFVWKIKVMSK